MRVERDIIFAEVGEHEWRGPEGIVVYVFAIVQAGAVIGKNCRIGSHSFIEAGAVIGDNVTIKNGCMIWDGCRIEDDCFIGPGVIFTNDARPQSLRAFPERYRTKDWVMKTFVGKGTSIGAGCLIAPGVIIAADSRIPMGTVVKESGVWG